MLSELSKYMRTEVHVLLRAIRDLFSGTRFSRVREVESGALMVTGSTVTQPFTHSATLEQKKHNLRLAAERIRCHVVLPGEVFSFWHAVGNPNTADFESSRGIVGGRLLIERGGGLCQASGVIYQLALLSRLEIVERHSHSKDIYTEDARFSPLGSDATVYYGYKDLRVRNTLDVPLRFVLTVNDSNFEACVMSTAEIPTREIEFKREDHDAEGFRVVETVDAKTGQLLARSVYEIM